MRIETGERIGSYVLVAPLGAGGQASVWKVRTPGGELAALKLFEPGGGSARARREAESLASLSHPCLVAFRREVVDDRGETVGLELELVDGQSLDEALRDPRMGREHRFAALAQVLAGAAEIHRTGLVHRDIKLENIVVSERFWDSPRELGTLKLVDFGIAAPMDNPHPLTAPNRVIGTSRYLPPELLDGELFAHPERGALRDVFALGVLACEILTGAHPTGLPPSAARDEYARAYGAAVRGALPWPPPGLEGRWGEVVTRCLSLHPDGRPPSAVEAIGLLRASQHDALTTPQPRVSGVPPATPTVVVDLQKTGEPRVVVTSPRVRVRSRRSLLVMLGVLVLLTGGVVTLFSPPAPTTCCGGVGCAPDSQNTVTSFPLCRVGATACTACSSGRRIVPRACTDNLGATEEFELVVADISSSASSPEVCLGSNRCAPVGGSLGRVRIAQLTQTGLPLTVRSSGRAIGVSPGRIPDGALRVTALCVGVTLRGFSGKAVQGVSFQLQDP